MNKIIRFEGIEYVALDDVADILSVDADVIRKQLQIQIQQDIEREYVEKLNALSFDPEASMSEIENYLQSLVSEEHINIFRNNFKRANIYYFNNAIYSSLNKIAGITNKQYKTLSKRLKQKYALESAGTILLNRFFVLTDDDIKEIRLPHASISSVIYGKEYKSLSEVAKQFNLPPITVFKRYQRGLRNEELVAGARKFKTPRSPKAIVVDGVEYSSVYQMAKETGIPYQTLISRINKGWSGKDLVTNHNEIERFSYDNKSFPSLDSLAKYVGISGETIKTTSQKEGCSIEEAIPIILERKQKQTRIVEGVEYKNLSQACKAYNKTYNYVRCRLAEGEDLETILTSETPARKNANAIPIEFRGKQYASKKECCAFYGVHQGVVHQWEKRGLNFTEALKITIKHKKAKPKPKREEGVSGVAF